jgi:hypothetical protein
MASAPNASELPPPWGLHTLPESGTVSLRLGSHDLWLRWREGEIRVAEQDRGAGSGDLAGWAAGSPAPEPPEEVEWSRWATPAGEREVLLKPALPDRAVVLEPEWAFRLLPGAAARVFVRVPLWIRIELAVSPESGEGRTLLLEEVPAVALSDTWWGDFESGELAYWLPTTARRAMAPRLFAPHVAVCPLSLENRAVSDLRVEKLAFRVAHLSLFAHEGRIWSDESRILYQGLPEGSGIEMDGQPPPEAAEGTFLSGPRSPVQKGFRARTFDRLRALQVWGA